MRGWLRGAGRAAVFVAGATFAWAVGTALVGRAETGSKNGSQRGDQNESANHPDSSVRTRPARTKEAGSVRDGPAVRPSEDEWESGGPQRAPDVRSHLHGTPKGWAERHSAESRDAAWAGEVEDQLRGALDSMPAGAFSFDITQIGCKSSVCAVVLEWPSFDSAIVEAPVLITRDLVRCLRGFEFDPPDDPAKRFQGTIMISCGE